MVRGSAKLVSLFAVPLSIIQLPGCAALNEELEALFLSRETDENRNPTPSHSPQQETFESRFNLFRWPETCIQTLRSFVLDSLVQTVRGLVPAAPEELARLTVHNHTWFHITRYAGSFVAHNHPLASWSAVYCVRPGEQPRAHPESGLLRLFDPRVGADAYQDAANRTLQAPYGVGPVDLRLEAGQLVVFPSYLMHEVTPFYGSDTRITVATNCWFA